MSLELSWGLIIGLILGFTYTLIFGLSGGLGAGSLNARWSARTIAVVSHNRARR